MKEEKSLGQIAYDKAVGHLGLMHVKWSALAASEREIWNDVARSVAHDLYVAAAIEADDQPNKPGNARSVQYMIRKRAWGSMEAGHSWDFDSPMVDEAP